MNLQGTVSHPAFSGPIRYHATPLSEDPDSQVIQTIDLMRDYIREDTDSAPIQREARHLAATGSGDPCSDVFWHIKNKVRFQRDETTAAPVQFLVDGEIVEVLIRPQDLAGMGAPVEDCDGFAQYAPTLLRALGVPCNLVTVAVDERDPDKYSHVYAACYPNGERVALDTSHGPYPGWECPNLFGKRREWPIDGVDWRSLLECGLVLGLIGLAVWAVSR